LEVPKEVWAFIEREKMTRTQRGTYEKERHKERWSGRRKGRSSKKDKNRNKQERELAY